VAPGTVGPDTAVDSGLEPATLPEGAGAMLGSAGALIVGILLVLFAVPVAIGYRRASRRRREAEA
jgi:hypothetical protein